MEYISLESNIVPLDSVVASMENINNAYTVTEKADGERKLLYVADNGKVYLIDAQQYPRPCPRPFNERTVGLERDLLIASRSPTL